MRRLAVAATLCALAALTPAAAAPAAPPPPGADHIEEYFKAPDGTTLHADVFRPKGLPQGARTPVIMAVSPYLAHSGATSYETGNPGGPSDRFYDFIEGARILERGYTWVQVDLRGFGGSSGCGDWGGPGEQMDVKAAVEHYAKQPWSTGKVGLYGKSYDGWTGLMGLAQEPEGLAAVVSQEPVYDGYRYLYMNRVPFSNRLGTPLGFRQYDLKPGHPTDTPEYQLNGLLGTATNPACYVENIVLAQNSDHDSAYWRPRNLVDDLQGVTTPTLLTQGFLESNTKPDAAFEAFGGLRGGEHQAIFGQFNHVRVNDRDPDGRPAMGREGLLDQVARFFDEHLKGIEPDVEDPAVSVQDNTGAYREEAAWPPADAVARRTTLLGGTYTDSGANRPNASARGLWSLSQPLEREAHLAGTPRVTVGATVSAPDANLVAHVFDVAPDGEAVLVSRGARLLPASGRGALELYGQDWRFAPGHRIAVLLSWADSGWFSHEASGATVTVRSAELELPLLARPRTESIPGTGPTARLEQWLGTAFALPAGAFDRETHFDVG
jgi:uncharacterized protein